MILLDDRVGSVHYASFLGDRCTVARLESADAAFAGSGYSVGVEIKRVPDAVNCLYSGRLADTQIPLMRQQYDVCYLAIEGLYHPSPEGVLQQYRGELGKWGHWHDSHSGSKRLMYSQFEQWLSTLEVEGGIRVRHTLTPWSTANLLLALENWWSRDSHKSFHVMHNGSETAALTRPTMLRRIAAQLPLIGWKRSGEVVKKFKSVDAMVAASVADWMSIDGIGKDIATKVVEALHAHR